MIQVSHQIETLDVNGQPTMTWRSGEHGAVRVTVRYREAVENPVVGIMIRTRIGFEVYGTNTELEGIRLGPCAAGQVLRVGRAAAVAAEVHRAARFEAAEDQLGGRRSIRSSSKATRAGKSRPPEPAIQ